MSPLSQAPPWVQSCGAWLGPGSMLMADAPGRDVQRRWCFFSVLVTYNKWGVVEWVTPGKDRSCRACRCLLSSDSPGMLIPVTTNTACPQLSACWWCRHWVGSAILNPCVEHTSFPWSTQQSGTWISERSAVSQHALKVISLLNCRSMLRSSWDLHYFLYKHVRSGHPVPKSL